MNEMCAKCKRIIQRGETSIASVKNLKKLFYHARCFGAGYLEAGENEKTAEQKREGPK